MKVALAAAVALLALAAAAGVAGAGSGVAAKPAGVDWGNRHFSHPEDLRAWLGHRGIRYQDWLRRHPGARQLWTRPAPVAVPVVEQSPPSLPVAKAGASGAPRWLYVLVALLLLLAMTPSRLLARVVPGRVDRLATVRTALAAAALSLGLGVLIASSL